MRAPVGVQAADHRIVGSEVVGFDETGLWVASKLVWVYSRPHRHVHPDYLPPPARGRRHRRGRCPDAVSRG